MNFTLTQEQQMLRDGARRFVAERHPFETGRAIAADSGFSRDHWQMFADLGWLALRVPEENGGLGWSLVDASILLEEFGRGLVAAPSISNMIVAPAVLKHAGESDVALKLLEDLAAGSLLTALAIEEADSRYAISACQSTAKPGEKGFSLTARKVLVHDGSFADCFLVTAVEHGAVAPSLFLVRSDAPGLRIRTYRTIDGHRAADLIMDDVEVDAGARLLGAGEAEAAVEAGLDDARICMAAEAVGIMDAAIAVTTDYLKQRNQFGRPLAEFQSLTHRLADMYVASENARAMVYRALSRIDADDRAAAVSATMLAVAQAGELVCGQAIQLHGGIGMTDEYVISHYYKRIRSIAMTYGDAGFHKARYESANSPAAASIGAVAGQISGATL
mgnify:CR=1 FL=1